jgi:hypothetical protein
MIAIHANEWMTTEDKWKQFIIITIEWIKTYESSSYQWINDNWRQMKATNNNNNWMNEEKWKQLIIITIEWMMLFSAGYATDELHVMDFLETIRGSGGRTNKYRCQLCTLESHDRSNMRRLGFSFHSKIRLRLGLCWLVFWVIYGLIVFIIID